MEEVEEMAVAAGAEGDGEGRGGDYADGALTLVAPEEAARAAEVEGHCGYFWDLLRVRIWEKGKMGLGRIYHVERERVA